MSPPLVPLRRVFRIANGGTPTSSPENWGGDIAWATPVDLAKFHGGKISVTQRSLTSAGLSAGSQTVPEGSLLVSSRAPIGYIAETTRPMAFNQGCKGLIPVQDVDIRFFRYQLSATVEQLQSLGQGSTFSELCSDNLASFPVVTPSLSYQEQIANYLDIETSRIDTLISKKRRIIELLNERTRLAARSLIMRNGHEASLRRFVDLIRTGTTPPSDSLAELVGKEVSWFSPGDIGYYLQMKEPSRTLSYKAITGGWCPSFPPESTLIVGIGATLGRVGHNPLESTGNQQITCVKSNSLVLPKFLSWQLWMRSEEIREIAPYTTLPILNQEVLLSLPFLAPRLDLQRHIMNQLDQIASRTTIARQFLQQQVGLLEEHRQALIMAATVGEVQVS